jgi:hypothetical protein
MTSAADAIDLENVSEYLRTTGISKSNLAACLRVIKKLVTGKGVTHRNKPGDVFLLGYKVTLQDDLEALRKAANAWLPYRKGVGCLDKGHGWALNHPLKKLAMYKKHMLAQAVAAQRADTTMAFATLRE